MSDKREPRLGTGQPALEAMSFEAAATEVGCQLQEAINALLNELPDAGPAPTGPELSAALGIDINLAWKLLIISRPGASLAGLLRMPGEGALRILLNAAKHRGVSAATLEQIRDSFASFDQLIDKHAGSRAALASLLSHVDGGPQRIDVATRRAAFRANSSMLGVQAAVQLTTYVLWPETIDGERSSALAILRGLGGFRRLRSDVSWIIGRGRRTDSRGRPYGQPFPQPLDPETAGLHGGVPLVKSFSSADLPPVQRTFSADGIAIDRIVAGPVGLKGSQSFFLAETMRPGLAKAQDADNPSLRLVTAVHTPCELLVFDVLFHQDLPGLGPPTLVTASELGGTSLGYCDPKDRVLLHLGAEIEDHGRGLRTAHIPELPRYPEMLGSICDRIGVRRDEFQVYRVTIAFPPIPCGVMIERDMNPA